jgi:cytochrome c-type biogenesis protein
MFLGNLTIGLAILAGMASFFSPCVLALVPAYVGYLGGITTSSEVTGNRRLVSVAHGIAFILGFSLVFILIGLVASAVGAFLFDARGWLTKLGGVVVILFGMHLIGVFKIPFLQYDTRVQRVPEKRWGFLSSALMGVFFAAGWSPCVGPVLGAILTLALNSGSISQGAIMLSAYSLGLAVPFLMAALGIGWVSNILSRHGRVMHYVEVTMGVVMVGVGIMLLGGIYETIAQRFQFFWIDFGI